MKKTFLKSLTTGIALIGLTSACSMISSKESAHKCGGKNSCKAGASKEDSKHKCGGEKNSCSAKSKK